MCGYTRRHITNAQLRDFLDLISPQLPIHQLEAPELRHYYPAFGGSANRTLDLIVAGDSGPKVVDATWWFDCKEDGDHLVVNNKRTTFNARNLTSPYWRGAIRHHRGIFLATGIGEGKEIDGKNRHFLVESEKPILLGCVYRPFPNGLYSAAVITRDSHPRFEPYHDKAFPLMLPYNADFLRAWLGEAPETDMQIAELLGRPRIFTDLKITPVKTFKGANPLGESSYLSSD